MKGVMIQGTASNVGKSLITIAFCRLLAQEGINVAPFKLLNMTKDICIIHEQKKIALSQALQAQASNVTPSIWMNPIVLNPKQTYILKGEPINNIRHEDVQSVMQKAIESLQRCYDALVLEGMGSPVELNLKTKDMANMAVAEFADVPVILVADISKGGVFASIEGTLALLADGQKHRVQGIVINKFHGDPTFFQDGVRIIEERTNISVFGVIPYINNSTIKEAGSIQEEDIDTITDIVRSHLNWDKVKQIMKRWSSE